MLGLLPYNSDVKLISMNLALDEWGKPVNIVGEELYKCYIREATTLEEQFNSKEIKITLVIGIKGNVDVISGDSVEVNNLQYKTIKTRKIRDLAGEVITTLVYV